MYGSENPVAMAKAGRLVAGTDHASGERHVGSWIPVGSIRLWGAVVAVAACVVAVGMVVGELVPSLLSWSPHVHGGEGPLLLPGQAGSFLVLGGVGAALFVAALVRTVMLGAAVVVLASEDHLPEDAPAP